MCAVTRERRGVRERKERDACRVHETMGGRQAGTVELLFCHAWNSPATIFVHPSIARNEKWPCLNVSRASQYGKQRVVDAAFTIRIRMMGFQGCNHESRGA